MSEAWHPLFSTVFNTFQDLLEGPDDSAAGAQAQFIAGTFENAFAGFCLAVFKTPVTHVFPGGTSEVVKYLRQIIEEAANWRDWEAFPHTRFFLTEKAIAAASSSTPDKSLSDGNKNGIAAEERASKGSIHTPSPTSAPKTPAPLHGKKRDNRNRPSAEPSKRPKFDSINSTPCYHHVAFRAGVAGAQDCSRGTACKHSHGAASSFPLSSLSNSTYWQTQFAKHPSLRTAFNSA